MPIEAMQRVASPRLVDPGSEELREGHPPSDGESVNELLDEIGSDYPATAVQMNAVAVKVPAVHLRNIVGTLTQNDNAEGFAIERKKSKGCERTSGRFPDLRKHRLMNRNIAIILFQSDVPDCSIALLHEPVRSALN